jgi:hypothetical protein
VVTLLVTDHLTHTWDIGHTLNLDVPLDADLIPGSFVWTRDHIVRVPGLFGLERAASRRRRADPLARLSRAGRLATRVRLKLAPLPIEDKKRMAQRALEDRILKGGSAIAD